MRSLGTSEKETDRAVAAGSSYTPEDLLERLRQDSSILVRRALIKNPTLPQSIIEAMRDDTDQGIRMYSDFRLKEQLT